MAQHAHPGDYYIRSAALAMRKRDPERALLLATEARYEYGAGHPRWITAQAWRLVAACFINDGAEFIMIAAPILAEVRNRVLAGLTPGFVAPSLTDWILVSGPLLQLRPADTADLCIGLYEVAQAFMGTSQWLDSSSAALLEHVADALYASGRPDTARPLYRRLVRTTPSRATGLRLDIPRLRRRCNQRFAGGRRIGLSSSAARVLRTARPLAPAANRACFMPGCDHFGPPGTCPIHDAA